MIKSLSELHPGDHIKWQEKNHKLPPEMYKSIKDLERLAALENRAHHAIVVSSSGNSLEVVHDRNGWITTSKLDREPSDLYVYRYAQQLEPEFTVKFAKSLTTDTPPSTEASGTDVEDIFEIPSEKKPPPFEGCHNPDGSAFYCECEVFAKKLKGLCASDELYDYMEKLEKEHIHVPDSVKKLFEKLCDDGSFCDALY